HLQALSLEDTRYYITHRLEVAGNASAVDIPPESLEIVFRYSKGVPRLINIICDFLMLSAFAEETNEISIDMVRDIIGDLDFDCQYWSPATNPAEEARLSDKGPHGPSEGLSEAQEMRNILVDISRRIDSFENQIADLNKKLEEIM